MYAKIYLFLLVSFLCSAFAQNIEKANFAVADTAMQTGKVEDEVNIDSLVAEQIAIAQAKKWEKAPLPPRLVGGIKIPFPLGRVRDGLFLAMFVFTVVFARRLILKTKSKTKNLRSNIQSIRLEKTVTKKETKLKVIRKNLLKSSVNLSPAEGSLTRKAKQLKIAKGEIILAAKIKSYELSICSNER